MPRRSDDDQDDPPLDRPTRKPRDAASALQRTASTIGYTIVALLLLVIAGAAIVVSSAVSHYKSIPRWEYEVTNPDDAFLTTTMNRMGSNGWELVSARRAEDPSTRKFNYEMIFKRPVP